MSSPNPITDGIRTSGTSFGSRTDVGKVRERNEDSLLVVPPLYVVCDGMGGHEAGDVASEIAVSTLAGRAPKTADANALGRAVEEANFRIVNAAADGRGKPGMGTTCTAAILDGTQLVIAQVGDSRAYLLHHGELQQLTRDHSVVADLVEAGEITKEEARTHQWRSYITRALGLDPHTKPDLYEIDVEEGDRLLLCSDGLYSMVDDEEIREILFDESDCQKCADALVEAALAAGGTDNVTVVVADVVGNRVKRAKKKAVKGKVTAVAIVLLLALVVGGFVWAFDYWVDNSAYLGESDGKVAIYRGVPGEVFGMGFSSLEEVTDVSMDDLPPNIAQHIRDDEIRCDSIEAARELVQEYEAEIEGASDGTTGSNGPSSSSGSSSTGRYSSSSSSAATRSIHADPSEPSDVRPGSSR